MARSLTKSLGQSLCFLVLALLAACGGEQSQPAETTAVSAGALTEQRRVGFVLPSGVEFGQVALGANGSLKLDDRVKVLTPANGFALSTNAGTVTSALTDVGLDTKLGSVISNAAVSLKDRAFVTGSVTSGRTVSRVPSAVVTGSITQNALLTPVQELSWNVSFTVGTTDVTASSGQSRSVTPGTYRNVTAFTNGTVTLNGAGTYYFDKLDLQPNGRLTLNGGAGNIFIYVRSTLIYRGTTTGLPAERLALAYLGTAPVVVESSFNGTFVAPAADVRFGTGNGTHSGAVLARGVRLDPNVSFTFRPYSRWDQLTFNVVPTFACVDQRTLDAGVSALLGYYNPNQTPVSVPVGTTNRFTTGAENRGQPVSFLPGRSSLDFGVDFGAAQSLTWSLQGTSLAVARTATACTRSASFDSSVDTTVVKAAPRDNFGASDRLTLAPDSHVLVKFDRSAIKQVVGSSRTVARATLEFTLANGDKPAAEAFKLARSRFTEPGATWRCADDSLTTPDQEACAAGTEWSLQRGAAEEAGEVPPWRPRTPERTVRGTWTGNRLSFDVTRDAVDLLGNEGVRRGMSWLVAVELGATGSAALGSRESTLKPKLSLELTSFPDRANGGLGTLSFNVDPSAMPAPQTAEPLPDGVARPFAGLADPTGRVTRFLERELVVSAGSHDEIVAFAARWGGQILKELAPNARAPEVGYRALVRVDASRANVDGLAGRLRAIDNRQGGVHRVSTQVGLATLAAAAQEVVAGTRVGLNFAVELHAPTLENYFDRNLQDGQPDPLADWNPYTAGVAENAPLPGNNAFRWPGFSSCNPALSDPSNPDSPKFCSTTMPDGAAINQHFAVADAWRALALAGRLRAGSVRVGLVDNGWQPDADYPIHTINNVFNPSSPLQLTHPYHGNTVVRAGFAVPGNGFAAAGPGGPVVQLELLSRLLDDSFDSDESWAVLHENGARIISASYSRDIVAILTPLVADVDRYRGAMIIASAGNDGMDIDASDCLIGDSVGCWEEMETQPCESDGVVCVGGLDYNSTIKDPGSNWGSDGDVDYTGAWFPFLGTGTSRPMPTGETTFFTRGGGTSSAAPHVAGITSLIMASGEYPSLDKVRSCLAAGSQRIPFGQDDEAIGTTRMPNALASVRCMLTGSTEGNLEPYLRIEEPSAGGITLPRGQLVTVRATALDYESGKLQVTWRSNVDGLLGSTISGQNGLVAFRTAGRHLLTASATATLTFDSLPPVTTLQPVTHVLEVFIENTPPAVSIVAPAADGETFLPGAMRFAATGSAVEVPIGAEYSWRSVLDADGSVDFDGVIQSSMLYNVTRPGAHTVTVTRTETGTGLTATATRRYTIGASSTDSVEFVSPLAGADGWAYLGLDESVLLLANTNIADARIVYSLYVNGNTHPIAVTNGALWFPYQDFPFSCSDVPGILYVTSNSVGHHAIASMPIRVHPGGRTSECLR